LRRHRSAVSFDLSAGLPGQLLLSLNGNKKVPVLLEITAFAGISICAFSVKRNLKPFAGLFIEKIGKDGPKSASPPFQNDQNLPQTLYNSK